ncbi:MAG: hypothetical protein J6J36_07080 [Clostridia bacterium]|nr:hypothetical protein [Clostridia bacterium]
MKAENEQELLTGLRIMRSHLNILIECLEKTPEFEKPYNKQFLRNITLDLRELYESYYLDKKGE